MKKGLGWVVCSWRSRNDSDSCATVRRHFPWGGNGGNRNRTFDRLIDQSLIGGIRFAFGSGVAAAEERTEYSNRFELVDKPSHRPSMRLVSAISTSQRGVADTEDFKVN